MSQDFYKWLLEKGEKVYENKNDQMEWIKRNYNFEITDSNKFLDFLDHNNYIHISLTYLETFDEWKIVINDITLFKFVEVDQKINKKSLKYISQIQSNAISIIKKYIPSFQTESNPSLNDIVKYLNNVNDEQKKLICDAYEISYNYFNSLVKHLENIEFLREDITKNKGSMISYSSEDIKYASLFEYLYYCIKYLSTDLKAEQYANEVKQYLQNFEINNLQLKTKYVFCFPFVKWEN